jgi:hypothetical protein
MLGINTKITFVPVDGDEELYTFWHHEAALTVNVPFQPCPKDKISLARALRGAAMLSTITSVEPFSKGLKRGVDIV